MRMRRSSTAAPSRRWPRGSRRAFPTGAGWLTQAIGDCTSAVIAGALIVLAAASVFLTACAREPKSAGRAPAADALSALSVRADMLAREDELAGAVLVARDGQVLFSRAYGLADRKRRIPNAVPTRFRIGSMTKMFTAVAILQLVEAGTVKLTAPLGTYLPGYPNREVATNVTIHQLAAHTSGLGELPWPDVFAHRRELRTLADYATRYGKRVGLEFQPGSRWAYSNYDFLLLGLVIEKVTGVSYDGYVQQHIYAPAGMTRSGSPPENQAIPGLAIGYHRPK
jgi:D-alanyl-D-alanine carboxypeptidase